jgi:squalene-hopene/tetraprenyl-beta-curcumene cyclase
MTYAGFKSYLYARLDRDDPRVRDALKWIRNHYTLEHNPGMPENQKLHGYYYYLMVFSRALDAWGATYIETPDGKQHDWANELIDKLAAIQNADGSWQNKADRWMEGDTNLVTCYALIALQHALR